jgi:hypothetical protein
MICDYVCPWTAASSEDFASHSGEAECQHWSIEAPIESSSSIGYMEGFL